MTAESSVAADPSDRSDLSSAFGRPAASSLRGLLPPRPRRSTEDVGDEATVEETLDETAREESSTTPDPTTPDATTPDPTTPDPTTPDPTIPDPTTPDETDLVPAPPARPARHRTAGEASERTATVANRRWGSVRLASREHVELLVLVALHRGPADGRELAARLRDDSGGGLAPPPTTLQRTFHHLARHGLVERVDTDRRRYRLTDLGTRIARGRVRAWRAMRRAVDAVVDAAGDV